MQEQFTDDRLLTRPEVHTHFGLTQRFLEVAAVKGNGPPFIKLGRAVRYRCGDIRDWIEARRVASTSQEVGQ
ncbi:putative DNA-binding transcriptional regulator AlpA [Roseovarius sp. MBR-78]|jgi:predicted DNA-binding transcriptional regulator AlpA|uniref:helix-turn-helix transcriptional regulator n=1 Tax=Roseovarius sp. MBR-78 TaxID=3156460 RepID=UPI00339B3670